jgi:hypothetical protein
MDLELVISLVLLIGLLSKGKILHKTFFSISSQIDSRSNRPQSADKKLTAKTLFYEQLLYEIISLQKFAMSKKRTFTYTYLVFLFYFLSARVLSASYGFVCSNTRRV